MKVIDIGFKLLLVGLVSFGVATLWVDKNTPTLQQIKNEKYAETLSGINESKEIELKARADQKERIAKKQKVIQGLYICVDFDTEKVTYIDVVDTADGFRLSNDCQKTPCRAKDSLRCTLND